MKSAGIQMSAMEIWAAIDAQRERIAVLLAGLGPEQWRNPSLCEGWTVWDVAAHLTLQQLTPWQAIGMGLRYGGSVNRVIHLSSMAAAHRLSEDQIIDRIRSMIGERRHNAFVTIEETLIDAFVHGLDIAVPLGLDMPLPERVAALAVERVVSYGGGGKAKVFKHLGWRGYRLHASDLDWEYGEGEEVSGPAYALLLLVTGRPVALERLNGPGADRLRAAT